MDDLETVATETEATETTETTATPATETVATQETGTEATPSETASEGDFSDEDIAALKSAFKGGKLDTTKLPSKLRSEWDRNFHAHADAKQREMEARIADEVRRAVELTSATVKTKQDFKTVEEYYDADPEGCLAEMDKYYQSLDAKLDDPNLDYAEEKKVNRELIRITKKRSELLLRGNKRNDEAMQKATLFQQANQVVLSRIPDFPKIAEPLNNEMLSRFKDEGLSPLYINALTSPEVWDVVARHFNAPELRGLAPTMSLVAYKIFQEANAGKTAAAKKKTIPNDTAVPGVSPGTKPTDDIKKLEAKARETGNSDDILALLAAKDAQWDEERKRKAH